MSDRNVRIKWTNEEWLRVAVNMLPFLEQGLPRAVALQKSQRRCLPSERQRDQPSLIHAAAPSSLAFNKYLDIVRALPEDERASKTVPMPERKKPAPRKKLDEGRVYTGNFRWTTLEKAKIARMVSWFKEHGVTSSLGRMMVEAQELVLPADRRRAVAGLMQGNHTGANQRAYDDGINNLWLLKDIPFNPPRPPGSEPEEVAEAEQAQEAPETAQEATNEPEPVQTQPERAIPERLMPATGGTLREAMTVAVAQFGDTLRAAMDTLLLQHTALVIHQMETRMVEQASRTASEVAALIERQLRASVHAMVEQELGPVSPPSVDGKANATPHYAPAPAPLVEAPAPAPEAAPKSRQLKVDVVGLNTPDLEQRVRRGFGPEVDLRFFDPDSKGSYAPHRGRECIMVTQRVPHALRHKIKAAGIEPLYVKATEGHVIHAIEELQRAHNMALAAHQH